ncbi:MAG: methyltransferase domain-containing protein [Caldilineaceae bacterium]
MSIPKGYVDPSYLQATAQLMKALKQRTYTQMHVQPGQKVLDVGCGAGMDTLALAQVVGPGGHVVGVDYDQGMVDEANRRGAQVSGGARLEHRQADATALPFASGEFDACRSERLFQHLPNPALAIAEMSRVTKSGGWIVVLDTDWGTLSIDTPEVDIERRLVRFQAERLVHNGYAGRQLYRLFKQQQLAEITVEMHPGFSTSYAFGRQYVSLDAAEKNALAAGVITADELARWHAALEQAEAANAFFSSVSMMLVAGRKP